MAEPNLEIVEIGNSLGKGCCGEVFELEDPGSPLVVKIYNSMAVDRIFMDRNFRLLRKLRDIEGLACPLDMQFDSTPYQVLSERIKGRALSEFHGIKEGSAWEMIRNVAEALGEAHKYGACHGHLHPGNILVEEGPKKRLRPVVTDFGSGLIGEIHHIDIGNSAFFAAPEQLETGGRNWQDGYAHKWDVYSFGVIAFWLINERHPRGLHYMKLREKEQARSGGRPVPIDTAAYLDDLFDSPKVSWGMSFGLNREFKLFREIIDDCLALEPGDRPVDMREVRNRFRALDSQFALEDAEERVVKERRKQRAKLFGARAMAMCLGAFFLTATYYLVDYLKKTYFFQNKVTELDQVVLTQKATITHLDERWAETVTDLKTSREAADSFFQKMARGYQAGGSGVATLKKADLEKSRDYYLKVLKDVSANEGSALERARAMHSLAHIERKANLNGEALSRFGDAIPALEKILSTAELKDEIFEDIHMRLADSHENISTLLRNPIGVDSLKSLEQAVIHFDELLERQPEDLEIVMRQAGTCFKLGRAYDAHREFDKAIQAYSKSAAHAMALRETSPEEDESLTELVGKLQFSAASSLANAGRVNEAIDAHVASMETIEQLRHVNGFSPLQSIQLASSFLKLGELFATREATTEDLDQLYNEALRLLTPLNTDNPNDIEVATLLSSCLSRLGHLERSEGRWSAGYRLSTRGIELLKAALGPDPFSIEGLLFLAEARLKHLEFLEAEKEAALKIAREGIETAETARSLLAKGETQIHEPLLTQITERLEKLFRNYGDVCQNLGDSNTASRCYELAEIQLVSAFDRERDTAE